MKKQPYIHPSQGEPAKAYYERVSANYDKHFWQAGAFTLLAAASYVTAVEFSTNHRFVSLAFCVGGVACVSQVMDQLDRTDDSQREADEYIQAGREHYSIYQAPTPEWLLSQLTED